MIYGIQTSGIGGPVIPPSLPDGATSYADFTAAYYYADGGEVAVTDIFGNDTNADSGYGTTAFHAGEVSPGVGYTTTTGDYLAIIGPMLTDILAGATVLIEFSCGATFTDDLALLGGPTFTGCTLEGYASNDFALVNYETQAPVAGPGGTFQAGTNKVAVNFGASGAFSANGGANVTISGYPTFTPNYFVLLGVVLSGEGTLRRVTVYNPAKVNGDLPTLSA